MSSLVDKVVVEGSSQAASGQVRAVVAGVNHRSDTASSSVAERRLIGQWSSELGCEEWSANAKLARVSKWISCVRREAVQWSAAES